MKASEEVATMVHAFPDKGRKDAVRALAARVARLEETLPTSRLATIATRTRISTVPRAACANQRMRTIAGLFGLKVPQ